jgi:nucleosome binding factor SPN SPT16 subunit
MGIFMHESNLTINEQNERLIQAGNCFLLVINLPDIK